MMVPESIDQEDPAFVKKYRAYLTRRSKWEAIALCSDPDVAQVSAVHLRDVLAKNGEVRDFLDDKWEKRVLGSDKFKDIGSGFYALVDPDEEPSPTRPEWTGRRPGQNFGRDAHQSILASFPHVDAGDLRNDRVLLGGPWDTVADLVVHNLSIMKKRGSESPLAELFDYAWRHTPGTAVDHTDHHALLLWLTIAMADTDAFKRLSAYVKKGEDRPADILGQEDGRGSPIYTPRTTRFEKDDNGEYRNVPRDPSPEGVMNMIRALLVQRGLMPRRRRR